MTYHRTLVALALAAVLLVPGLVLAEPSASPGPGAAFGQRLQQELGLTDQQVQALREIHQRQREAARQVWRDLGRTQRELRQLALGGGDDATIQAKVAEIERLYGQSLELRVNALREMAPILSEEQRQKLAQMTFRPWHRRPPVPTPQG